MLNLDEIKEELKKPHYNVKGVARGAGIPAATLYDMLRAENALYGNVKAVSDYLESIRS